MKQEIIAGIALCIIGAALLTVPAEKLWNATEKWKMDGEGKPSKRYIAIMRTLGVVFAGVGIGLAVCSLSGVFG